MHKLYQARAVERPTEELRRIVYAALTAIGLVVAVSFVFQFKALSRFWILSILVFVVTLMAIERTIARRMFNKLRRAGLMGRPVLIVGTDADAVALLHAAQRTPHLGYRVVGFVGADDIGTRGGCEVLGPIERTADVLEATGATGVLISLSSVESEVVNRLTRDLTDDGYHVALSSGLHDIDIVRFRAQDLGGRTLIYVEQVAAGRVASGRQAHVRHRPVAVFALVLTAPITLVTAIAVKRSSPGPVIFAQERVGRDGETFRVLKFRTMVRRRRATAVRARWPQRGRRADVQDGRRPSGHQGRARCCASCRSTRSRSSSTCCAAR